MIIDLKKIRLKYEFWINYLEFPDNNSRLFDDIRKIIKAEGDYYEVEVPYDDGIWFEFISESIRISVFKTHGAINCIYVDVFAIDDAQLLGCFDKCIACGSEEIADGILYNHDKYEKEDFDSGKLFYMPAAYDRPGTSCPNRLCRDCGFKWFDKQRFIKMHE